MLTRVRRRGRRVVSWLPLAIAIAFAPQARADESLATLLDSRALEKAPNPVPVNYLLNEGKGKLAPAADEKARTQLVAALKLQTNPMLAMMSGANAAMNTPAAQQIQQQQGQVTAGSIAKQTVANLFGVGGLTQPPPPSAQQMQEVQQQAKQAMADPWVRGLEAADAYIALGDAQSAGRFYASCLAMPMGIDWLVETCLGAVLRLGGPRANALLDWMIEHPEQAMPGAGASMVAPGAIKPPAPNDPSVVQLRSTGLEGIGRLIGSDALDAAQREHAFTTLMTYSEGKANAPYYAGAAAGLGFSKDPRALPRLRALLRGAGKDAHVQDAALGALVLGFGDADATRELRKALNDKDDERRLRAAAVLFQAGDAAAFEWAVAVVTAHRAAEDQKPDIRARVVRDLLERGGAQGKTSLAEIHRRGAGNDWLDAWVDVALLESGDTSELKDVRAALANTHWTLDRAGVQAWWGRVRPLVQLAAQLALTGTVSTQQVAEIVSNLVANERGRYSQHSSQEEMLLAQLQWQAADAFAASGDDSTVADLTRMLADTRDVVRISAARALAIHPSPTAIDGYGAAFGADFGSEQDVPRAPEVRSALLRAALVRHPKDPRTLALCKTAASDSDPGVRFIALAELGKRGA